MSLLTIYFMGLGVLLLVLPVIVFKANADVISLMDLIKTIAAIVGWPIFLIIMASFLLKEHGFYDKLNSIDAKLDKIILWRKHD